MSNSNADRVSDLKILFSVEDTSANTDQGDTASVIRKEACCSVPIHYAWIDPENCRSLAIFQTKKKITEPTPSIIVTPDDPNSSSLKIDTVFLLAKQRPEDTATDTEEKGSGDTFQFSDDEDDGKTVLLDATRSLSLPPKRDRLEIASSVSDMRLEIVPENFEQMPKALQDEFHELHTIPVVSKSQEARISTIEDETQKKRKKWGELEPDTPKNARFTYEIDWDVFMPNLFVLQQAKMLMVGAVGFSAMFKPVLSPDKKSLSHTERIFADIAKNTNILRDHIFLKIPFPGAKKKDGCRAIPFGFIPLVLHYLRPAPLRNCIVVKRTRSLLLQCYREVARYFQDNMPPIAKRQLRQFATNMEVSMFGRIGTPLSLLRIRSGFVDSDVTGDNASIESVCESDAGAGSDSEREPIPVSIPASKTWPVIKDHEFSSDSEEEGDEEEDEEGDEDEGEEEEDEEEGDEDEEEESADIVEEDEEADFMDVDTPRQSSFLRDRLLEMRYNHHTDDELDALISHHLDVIGELNEVRRMRRVATRPLREKLQSREVSYDRKSVRVSDSTLISPTLSPSRKRKRPSVPANEEQEAKKKTSRPKKRPSDVQPPSKRVAVGTATAMETPKKKLRVYRMQSNQLLSSLPEALEWTLQLLAHVMQFRPQFQQASGGGGEDDEMQESSSGDVEDVSFEEEPERESLGDDDSSEDEEGY